MTATVRTRSIFRTKDCWRISKTASRAALGCSLSTPRAATQATNVSTRPVIARAKGTFLLFGVRFRPREDQHPHRKAEGEH
jgi:hypothetical protein